MKLTQNTDHSIHQEALILLPWYANKTLQGEELILVEKHLKKCLTCKIELAGLNKLSIIVSNADPFAPAKASSYSALRKRLKNIDQPATVCPDSGEIYSDKSEAYKGKFQFFRRIDLNRILSGQLPLALVAVFVLAVFLLNPMNLNIKTNVAKEYYTLSSSQGFIAKEDEIQIVFSEAIKRAKIDEILSSVQAVIVNQANRQGVFTIRLDEAQNTAIDIHQRISILRKNPNVLLVTPGNVSQPLDSLNENKLGEAVL